MAQWINLSLVVALAPLAGAVIAGLLGRAIGRRGAHSVAILGVAAATVASGFVFQHVVLARQPIEADLYTWTQVGTVRMNVGFLIDALTATMMLVVSFVSQESDVHPDGPDLGPGIQVGLD